MKFFIPKTREKAITIFDNRRELKKPMLKYDMFLISIIYCSYKEFKLRTHGKYAIYGTPCICKYYGISCDGISCGNASQETFAMKWDDKLGN